MSNFINLTLVDDGSTIKVDAMIIDAMRSLPHKGKGGAALCLRSGLEVDVQESMDEVEALIEAKVEEFMRDDDSNLTEYHGEHGYPEDQG